MSLMTIGDFSQRTRLSPKPLRLYGELGLVVPARVDPDSGYRWYAEDQLEPARLVALLRRLDMPLETIARVTQLDDAQAAHAIRAWWAEVEATTRDRRELVAYLQTRLSGGTPAMDNVYQRNLPTRTVACISRHLRAGETDAFFDEAFARLRALAPGLEGIAGAPFLIFYGEVSEDSDGPMELCRPLDADPQVLAGQIPADIQVRREAAHEEAYIRLALKEASWPAMVPAYEALEHWASEHAREPAGAPRQLLIADQRTATPDTLVIDLSVPLR
jgi:DNA-binding transcriptional MerR regulator